MYTPFVQEVGKVFVKKVYKNDFERHDEEYDVKRSMDRTHGWIDERTHRPHQPTYAKEKNFAQNKCL